jgi:formylmethanofuran dehydrogenase subunit E
MAKKDNAPKDKPEKKYHSMRCEKCGVEFPDAATLLEHQNVLFVLDDKILCKDCLVMSGGNPANAQIRESFHNDDGK